MLRFGTIVKSARELQGRTLEDVADGIMSVSNLSRIENGSQPPSWAKREALIQKLQLSPEVLYLVTDEKELKLFRLKHEINQALIHERYRDAEILAAKIEKTPGIERLFQQIVQYVRAIIMVQSGHNPTVALEAMRNAVMLSVKDCAPDKLLYQAFTFDELGMLRNLAVAYYNAGNHDMGIDLLKSLKDYIERRVVDSEGVSTIYVITLFILSKWVGLQGEFEMTIKLCDIGIQHCIEYNTLFSLAGLIYNKAFALSKMARFEEALEQFQDAYHLYRAQGNMEYCRIVKQDATMFGLDF